MIGPYKSCDVSWLNNDNLINPLSIGQYINNATQEHPANVTYQELDIPVSFPLHLWQYIPNVNFNVPSYLSAPDIEDKDNLTLVRAVVLISLRDILEGEEVFSSYFTEIEKSK